MNHNILRESRTSRAHRQRDPLSTASSLAYLLRFTIIHPNSSNMQNLATKFIRREQRETTKGAKFKTIAHASLLIRFWAQKKETKHYNCNMPLHLTLEGSFLAVSNRCLQVSPHVICKIIWYTKSIQDLHILASLKTWTFRINWQSVRQNFQHN